MLTLVPHSRHHVTSSLSMDSIPYLHRRLPPATLCSSTSRAATSFSKFSPPFSSTWSPPISVAAPPVPLLRNLVFMWARVCTAILLHRTPRRLMKHSRTHRGGYMPAAPLSLSMHRYTSARRHRFTPPCPLHPLRYSALPWYVAHFHLHITPVPRLILPHFFRRGGQTCRTALDLALPNLPRILGYFQALLCGVGYD
ncbi:hypothetical protein HYPSUDRAFT_208823 [Hypholoma sublateritium FD-334 SS-4]|uniref:Uncharacterized protein n=1 Tax=Hypholoma sublateritium (strain FD-334 SS-4) TaxID=945553 RepID=A0A0D2KI59_HYPSF|nr:hypothetical protein HYPSUDRAFT_208823 [Hypholoma sublateritium FD-334 SS-4]